jgi:tetratricopeptide (TPR) repeat protein
MIQHEINVFLWRTLHVSVPTVMLVSHEDARLAYEIGDSYFISVPKGRYDLKKAEAYYIRALELNPKFSNPWMQLGRIDFLNGNFASAVTKFNKIVVDKEVIDPATHTGFYYWRGLVNGYLERYTESENDFLKVIEGNKINNGIGAWAAYVDLAWVYFQRGKFDEIKNVMEEAVMYYPDNPWVLTMYGIALYNLGMINDAHYYLVRAEEEVLKLTPEDWSRSYPGNNPLEAPEGLAQLIGTIEYNSGLVLGSASTTHEYGRDQ